VYLLKGVFYLNKEEEVMKAIAKETMNCGKMIIEEGKEYEVEKVGAYSYKIYNNGLVLNFVASEFDKLFECK
jgi:hypothetical protein